MILSYHYADWRAAAAGHRKQFAIALMVGFALLAVLAVCNVWRAFFTVPNLGDGGLIPLILSNPGQKAKYFLGFEAMRMLYDVCWIAPSQFLPHAMSGHVGFFRVVGAILMMASTIILLRISNVSWRIVLAVTTPIWLLFSSGYVEYYPFIAGLFLAFLYWVFSRPLPSHSPILIGAACSLLPLVYAAFAPYAAIVFCLYLYGTARHRWLAAVVSAICVFLGTIWLLWDGGIIAFYNALFGDFLLGERNTFYAAYQGLSAGEHSMFFRLDYALSGQHLREVLKMMFGGAGLVAICLLPVALMGILVQRTGWTRNDVLAVLLSTWSLAYTVLMLPKLGPVRDIDLFFPCYILFAFVIGRQAENYRQIPRYTLFGAWLTGSLVSTLYLFKLTA